MTVPKFKIGDKVRIKKKVYHKDELVIYEVRIRKEGVFYAFETDDENVIIEVAEDELELVENKFYKIRIMNDRNNNSIYVGSYNTREEAEEGRVRLIREDTGKIALNKDVTSITMSLINNTIVYNCDDNYDDDKYLYYGIEEVNK